MERDRRLSLIVGGFVIAGLGFLALAIVLLSSETGIFTPQYRLFASFDNVQGLLPGAPVWLAGKEVGRVAGVGFNQVDTSVPLQVELRIDRAVQSRIHGDSIARIGTIGLLGDSYVEVSVGSAGGEPLADGSAIQAVSPANLNEVFETGTQALDNIAGLAENLNTVVANFAGASGGARAAAAVDAVSDIVLEVQEGQGLLHSLIYDEYTGGGVESIERSLALMEGILEEVARGEGILHTLIYESPTEQDLVMQAIEAGARLNTILEKVNRGEGTLGLLLNDPTLYEDLKILVGGAQRSTVVRSLIRMAVEGEN
jgi:phospholipid/cholesterol/gamma-HCH transport system substrate-binding protein